MAKKIINLNLYIKIMEWKNFSYKKRGAIIGGIVFIFFQLFYWIGSSISCSNLIDPGQLYNLGGGTCASLFSYSVFEGIINLIFFIIVLFLSFLVGLLPGALIGVYYGKINLENNPFRMWGGWVLGIIGLLNQFLDRIDVTGSRLIDNFLVFIFFFIIGWRIHLLIRKMKYK
jgi:hypothetical protein